MYPFMGWVKEKKKFKKNSASGNRTPATAVKARDPNHWTNADMFSTNHYWDRISALLKGIISFRFTFEVLVAVPLNSVFDSSYNSILEAQKYQKGTPENWENKVCLCRHGSLLKNRHLMLDLLLPLVSRFIQMALLLSALMKLTYFSEPQVKGLH
jgi:hypothetical protein